MTLLIDGYNLMHAAGIVGSGVGPGGLERSRRALLNFIVESLEVDELARAVVVFDANERPPLAVSDSFVHRGLRVRFAADHGEADELIEELIRLDSVPKRLLVVSSDHRLHRAARRRKGQAIDSDRWYAQMVARRAARRAPDPRESAGKPAMPQVDSQVKYWLDQMGFGESAPREENSLGPFPPGHFDDLDDEPGRP
ncbi:MAG: NYN domain-containing protein [Pirellulales bacterium]|nr:NYN domain-containing protein [Pirellulales bacterium]